MSALATYKEKVEEFNQKMEALKQECATTFKEVVAGIFEANPSLKTIAWRQYTPSFNDGDPCTFRMNVDEPYLNGLNSYGEGDEDEDTEYRCDGINASTGRECGKYIDLSDEDMQNCPKCGKAIPRDTEEAEELSKELYDEIGDILSSFDESVLVFLFSNDNLTVTLHRDGTVDKEDYDCGY